MRDQYKVLQEAYKRLIENDKNEQPVYGDTQGIKIGTTGMPYGAGHHDTNKDFDKIVNLQSIHGVSEQAEQKYNSMHIAKLQNFIKQTIPWVQGYTFGEHILEPGQSLDNIIHEYYNIRGFFLFWASNEGDPNQSHHVERRKKAREVLKRYPSAVQDMDKVLDYITYISGDSPHSPDNPANYPLYVSLYEITQVLGGHEEGGWWQEVMQLLESVKVANYKQAENVAKQLYNSINQYSLDGKPYILLETKSGSQDTTRKPIKPYS